MEQIKQFIVDNWQFISSVGLSLFSLILLLLVKKRPVEYFYDVIVEDLLPIINEAEGLFKDPGQGALKKKYVLQKFMLRYPTYDVNEVANTIEDILLTPQKKLKGGK